MIFVIALSASCATQRDRDAQLAVQLCLADGGVEAAVNGIVNCADGTIYLTR